jgi:hypothetical protein
LARVEHALGHDDQAQRVLETVIPVAQTPDLLWRVQFWQAKVALSGNHLPVVELWRSRRAWRQDPTLAPDLIAQETLLLARLHLLEWGPDAALGVLDQRRAEAHAAACRAKRDWEHTEMLPYTRF